MAGKRAGLVERGGRFHARKVIPAKLRPYFDGKYELWESLGPDRRTANAKHPAAMAAFEDEIAAARRALAGDQISQRTNVRAHYPLTADQIAATHYAMELDIDMAERTFPDHDQHPASEWWQSKWKPKWRQALIRTAAGKAPTDEMDSTIGWAIDAFMERGNHKYEQGSDDWRSLAMKLAAAQLEAIARQDERDQAIFDGVPKHPALAKADTIASIPEPVSLKTLFADYLEERERAGKGKEARRRWTPVFDDLAKFLGHDDVNRITKKDVIAWKDAKLKSGLSMRTVKDAYIASLNAVLRWAIYNDRIAENPAERIKLPNARKPHTREKGFRDNEALAILKAAKAYQPARKEDPKLTAAKRWIPLLCAHTGARVGEMVQLRKQDLFEQNGIHAIRITPEAGTVKTGGYRNVPLHQQLIDEGFLEFVADMPDGYLFITVKPKQEPLAAIRSVQNRLREWLKGLDLIPDGVQPNHAWRHRLKTVGREVGVDSRVLDAIQGHASRTAGDNYGDVTVKAMQRALEISPPYPI